MIEFTPLEVFLYVDVFLLGVLITIAMQHAYTHFWGDNDDDAAEHSLALPEENKEQVLKEAEGKFKSALDTSVDTLQHDLKTTSDKLSVHLEELGNKVIHKEMDRYRKELDQMQSQADTTVEDVVSATETYKEELKGKLDQLHGRAEEAIDEVTSEIGEYKEEHKKGLDELHKQADGVITDTSKEITAYKEDLKGRLDALHEQADKSIKDVTGEIDAYKEDLKQKLSDEAQEQKKQLAKQLDAKLADAVTAFLLETLEHNVDLGAQSEYLTQMLEEHKDELKREITDED